MKFLGFYCEKADIMIVSNLLRREATVMLHCSALIYELTKQTANNPYRQAVNYMPLRYCTTRE